MEITIKKEILLQRVADLLCSAFESGGIAYWGSIARYHEPVKLAFRTDDKQIYRHLDYPLNEGGAVILKNHEEPERKPKPLTLDTIKTGLELMANSEKYAHHWRDFITENDDMTTADVFVQFCVFGEVIYG